MKLNSAEHAETIVVRIDKNQHPIAWAKKRQELIDCGMKEDEVDDYMYRYGCEFVMEVVYSEFQGLFMVESEAIECTPIYNPYDGTECEVEEDE